MARDLKLTASLNDKVSKEIDSIISKVSGMNPKIKAAMEANNRTVDALTKQKIAMQRASIALEERMEKQRAASMESNNRKAAADYERWWQRQLSAVDRNEKAKTAKQEREERQRIAMQRNSLALAEAQQAREYQKSLQNTKYLQDSSLRIERQAAIAEASLVLDRFDRRIAIERVKHQQILADLKGNDAAIEAEKRRHQAVIGRIDMDKGNFANTPFQKMLESFNKLNNGLGKSLPVLTTAAGQIGTMSGLAGQAAGAITGFGGALSSFALGPVGIAIAAVTAVSAGINAMIDSAERAANLKADFGVKMKDPAQAKAALEIMERYEKARANVGKNVILANAATYDPAVAQMKKASSDWKALAGQRIEDEKIWNAARLRGQVSAAAKTTDQAKQARKDAKTAQEEQWAFEREVRDSAERNAEAAERVAKRKADKIREIHEDEQKTAEIYAKRDAERAGRMTTQRTGLAMAKAGEDPIQKLAAQHAAELEEARTHGDDLTLILERQEIERTATAKKQADEREAIRQKERDSSLNAAGQLFSGLAALAANANMKDRSNRIRWKAAAITEATINTFRAEMQALADPSIPNPIAKAAAMIGIGALGMANVAKIKEQRFARGTDYAPGGMALVGEQGPEMVYLPKGSKVKTASETARMGSTINAPITINLSGTATQADAAKIGQAVETRLRALADDLKTLGYRGISR